MEKLTIIMNAYILEGVSPKNIVFGETVTLINMMNVGKMIFLYPRREVAKISTFFMGEECSIEMSFDEIIESF